MGELLPDLLVAAILMWALWRVGSVFRLYAANKLAVGFLKKGEYSAAEGILRAGLWGTGPSDPCALSLYLACRFNLGLAVVRQRKFQQAHDLLDGTAKDYARFRPDSREIPKSLHLLSGAQYGLGRYEAAMLAMQQAVNWIDMHPAFRDMAPNYRVDSATAQMRAGSYDTALGILVPAAAEERSNRKDELTGARLNLGSLYLRRGELPEADKILEQTLEARFSAFGRRDTRTGMVLNNLAWLRFLQRRYAESEALAVEALGTVKADWRTYPLHTLALLRTRAGRYAEAEEFFADAEKIRAKQFADPHPEIAMLRCDVARLRIEEGKLEAAGELLHEARSVFEKKLPPQHPFLGKALFRTGQLRLKQGRSQEAKLLLASALAIFERKCPYHPDTVECRRALEAEG